MLLTSFSTIQSILKSFSLVGTFALDSEFSDEGRRTRGLMHASGMCSLIRVDEGRAK